MNVSVWYHPWLNDSDSFYIRTSVIEGFEDLLVNDLIIPGTWLWDVALIREVFIDDDVDRILKTAISPIGFTDKSCWSHTSVESELERLTLEAEFVTGFVLNVLSQLNGEKVDEFVMVVWRLWKERNSIVWTGSCADTTTVVSLAHQFLHDWRAWKSRLVQQISVRNGCEAWHCPSHGSLKLNIDAAFFVDTLEMGIGLTLWDHNGGHVYSRTMSLSGLYALDEGEDIALFEALTWVTELDLRSVKIEMDAKLVVDAFNSSRLDSISVFGDIIEACKQKFCAHPYCSVGWVDRQANFVAHRLARIVRNSPSPFTWVELPFNVDSLPHTSCSC
ncbi:hypothetical protein ACS0TY_036598 [Phlomoides rotata]